MCEFINAKKNKMKKISFKMMILSVVFMTNLSSCKKDSTKPTDNHEHNESELITTLELKFSGKGSLGFDTTFVVSFNDPDGDGGNAATQFDTIHLLKNSTYNVEVTLLDKSKTPADTISNEVLKEANDHLFFYSSNPIGLVNIVITDKDGNNKNLGLKSSWVTSNPGSGKVKVKLMHQSGVKDGISEIGDTDVEVDFILQVR